MRPPISIALLAIGTFGALSALAEKPDPKFSLSVVRERVKREVPITEPEPAKKADTSMLFHDPVMPVPTQPDMTGEQQGTEFKDFEEFRALVDKLPKGIKEQDIVDDVVTLRKHRREVATMELVGDLERFVSHTGQQFIGEKGKLDVPKLSRTLDALGVTHTVTLARALDELGTRLEEDETPEQMVWVK